MQMWFVIGVFLIMSVLSVTLLVRLTYRYNAPVMRVEKKRRSEKRSFVAVKSRQEQIDGDYYIVDYVWNEGKRQKDYACRCLGVPPDEIRLKYISFGRLVVVNGSVDRMDNEADPYIAGMQNKFPVAAYALVLVPPVSAFLSYIISGYFF